MGNIFYIILKKIKSKYYIMSNIQNESSGQTSAQIYITSKSNYKRVISTNNYSNIMYYFNSSINVSDGFVFLISLHDAIIPVTWYVISSYNGNNLFNYEINNVSYSYQFQTEIIA